MLDPHTHVNILRRIVQVMILSIVPWVELRLAIPFGITKGLHPGLAFLCAVVASWIMIVPMFLILDLFYDGFLSRIPLVRQGVEAIRTHGKSYVERWGTLGVGIYVSLPIPGPGVYSGTILAWLFGLPRKQALIALALGVLVSAFLVTAISTPVIVLIRRFH
jgi:uncharacterized membrane protein